MNFVNILSFADHTIIGTMKSTGHIVSLISKIKAKSYKLIIDELKRNKVEGLAPSHGAILMMLYKEKNNICMKDLALHIGKDKSTITALIKKLEKFGYISKSQDIKDSRKTYISLTQKGKEIEPIFYKISTMVQEKIYTGFTQEEKIALITQLERVEENFLNS